MIFVSAGHHTKDPGAVQNGYKEADLTIQFRDKVVFFLSEKGLREGKEYIIDKDSETLSEYLRRIQTGTGSVVLEFHFDSSVNPTATGTTVLIPARTGTQEYELEMEFGTKLAETTSQILGIRNRGVWDETKSHRGKLGLMREAGINALLELCFISNKSDLEKYFANADVLAEAIADLLIEFDARK